MKRLSGITALLLAASLLCGGCGNTAGGSGEDSSAKEDGAETSADAATMRLEKTIGDVTVCKVEEEIL